jgi:hypothetical protein
MIHYYAPLAKPEKFSYLNLVSPAARPGTGPPQKHTSQNKTAGFAPFKPAPHWKKVVNLSSKSLGFYPRYGPAPKTHPH